MASNSISPRFTSVLREGNVYIISNFCIFKADQGYRPVTNEQIIRFTASTKVTSVSVPVPAIAMYKFEFVHFNHIHLRYPANIQLCGMSSITNNFLH